MIIIPLYKYAYSCILENEFKFYVSSTTCYFYNCTCQTFTASVSIKLNSIPSSSFLHALDCLETVFCEVKYDYLDDLQSYIPYNDENELVDTLSNMKVYHRRKIFQ